MFSNFCQYILLQEAIQQFEEYFLSCSFEPKNFQADDQIQNFKLAYVSQAHRKFSEALLCLISMNLIVFKFFFKGNKYVIDI